MRWYREHGYQFLVLTDHNFLTSVDGLNALHGADERFLVVRGEEVSSRAGDKPIHVNGLDVDAAGRAARRAPPSARSCSAPSTGFAAPSGVPHINHPNFRWAITGEELQQVRNNRLFEIFNGHPQVNNVGGGGVPGLEEVWDRILTSGTLLYGIAVDDAHVFKQPGNPRAAGPGRGWVMVRAARLEARALLEALERGDFYASTGVVLDDVEATATALTVRVKTESTLEVPHPVHRPRRTDAARGDRTDGDLHVHRRRRIRPRQGAREQRPCGLGAAGAGGSEDGARVRRTVDGRRGDGRVGAGKGPIRALRRQGRDCTEAK